MRTSRRNLIVAVVLSAFPLIAQQPIGEVFSGDASVRGSVVMTSTGAKVMSGSQVTAGLTPAILKLTRGGEIRICAGTNIAVSGSSPGSPLLFGVNTGSFETHYNLQSIADSIVTPDFRVQLPGPGAFHFAIGADARGNTCVRSLEGSTAAVIVSEMMGNGSYQVRPGQSVVFKEGKLENATNSAEPCGCPATPKAVEVANANTAPASVAEAPKAATTEYVAGEAPLVFHGEKSESNADQRTIVQLRTRKLADIKILEPTVTVAKAPARKPEEKKGFFHSIGSFFSHIFK